MNKLALITLLAATSVNATTVSQTCSQPLATLSVTLNDQNIHVGENASTHYSFDFTTQYSPYYSSSVLIVKNFRIDNQVGDSKRVDGVPRTGLKVHEEGNLPPLKINTPGQYTSVMRVIDVDRGCDLTAVSVVNVS